MLGSADTHKAFLFACVSNLAIAIAKLAAAVYTGSGAMLAETVHSLIASISQGLLLWGLKTGKKPPAPDYPGGFGKSLYFWAFITALILFSLGGMLSIYESSRKLSDPESMRAPWLPIAVLVFSMLSQGIGLWTCLRSINAVRGDLTPWRWLRRAGRSELHVLLGEHLAALLGLGLALLAISLSAITDNPLYDCVGGIAIGGLLIAVALGIGMAIKHMLTGPPYDDALRTAIAAHLQADPVVAELCELLILPGEEIIVLAKARLAAESAEAMYLLIQAAEMSLQAAFPQVRAVFLQPVPGTDAASA